jgi:endo-1,4-beta-xylanase
MNSQPQRSRLINKLQRPGYSNGALKLSILALALGATACVVGLSGGDPMDEGGAGGAGGQSSGGGASGSGGVSSSGGTSATGGAKASGGSSGRGGSGGDGSGGATVTGGTKASGGTSAAGGSAAGGQAGQGSGGVSIQGTGGSINRGTGGNPGTGGRITGTGGKTGSGGSTSTTTDPVALDCNAAMPTSGGKSHSGNSMGGSGNLAWQIWSNQGTGTLTTFDNIAAFSSGWNNSGNYLGRLGFEWGNSGKTYDQYGTITAQFTEKKNGSSGGAWSYVGIYGWSNDPCIEWYIIDDSYSKMPINPGNCNAMKNSPLSIDDGNYTMCVRNTSGTGGDRCGGISNWNQYYSIRQSNRTCGTISVTEHFKAWEAAGNKLGKLLEVKILLEVGGGQGTVDFPIANVMKTQ